MLSSYTFVPIPQILSVPTKTIITDDTLAVFVTADTGQYLVIE